MRMILPSPILNSSPIWKDKVSWLFGGTSETELSASVCALRAVTSIDGMTADVYPFDAAFLSRVATRIVNEVKGINRVVYDYTSKPPGTIEWE